MNATDGIEPRSHRKYTDVGAASREAATRTQTGVERSGPPGRPNKTTKPETGDRIYG